jgi:putative sterol carrier protein
MSVADDLQEIFDKMPQAFQAEKAAGVKATVQLDLSGDGGGNWKVEIANGQIATEKGEATSPDLTLQMEARDYVALTRGEANPMNLFMSGKIKLQGDMTLAMKFQEMFDMG